MGMFFASTNTQSKAREVAPRAEVHVLHGEVRGRGRGLGSKPELCQEQLPSTFLRVAPGQHQVQEKLKKQNPKYSEQRKRMGRGGGDSNWKKLEWKMLGLEQ